jgi:hypothetical protein
MSSAHDRSRANPGTTTSAGRTPPGIVWRVGDNVTNVKVGDEVVVHCGSWDIHAPEVLSGEGPYVQPKLQASGDTRRRGDRSPSSRRSRRTSACPRPEAPELGSCGSANAGGGRRPTGCSSAGRPTRVTRERRRPRLGRRGRPRIDGHPAGGEQCGCEARRGDLQRQRRYDFCKKPRRGRLHQPEGTSTHWGRLPQLGRYEEMRPGSSQPGRGPSARPSGMCSESAVNPRIVFEHPGQGHGADFTVRL